MTVLTRSIVIHSHFYQPPREDPWFDEVPAEPSAAPFHDWNARIESECYRAVTAARIPNAEGRIARIMNTLAYTSFDAGPTLLAWMETAAPDTYRAILRADRASAAAHDGHGNALAAPYHHVILPLSPRRDKVTEIRWGIADFARRFGRPPEGMWLPETAVDDETLDVLAELGIAFTILAPHQVIAPAPAGLPGRYRTSGHRSIALFPYDGPISHDVAFGPFVRDASRWVAALTHDGAAQLVAVATDGETYGHHHRFGEMALAAVLTALDGRPGVRVENFASFLARHPARHEVKINAPSSWSCTHGVDRWRRDCGCRLAPEQQTSQAWRAPLRDALDWLAGEVHGIYEGEGVALFGDPWAARDAYGEVVADAVGLEPFLNVHCRADAPAARVRAAELLEMERHALGMFTSCGWFFDDLARIETRQVLRYAARAIDLAGPAATRLAEGLREQRPRVRHRTGHLRSLRDAGDPGDYARRRRRRGRARRARRCGRGRAHGVRGRARGRGDPGAPPTHRRDDDVRRHGRAPASGTTSRAGRSGAGGRGT
jgi:alpha-amylase/alpha-mannosidase (GH57 family)